MGGINHLGARATFVLVHGAWHGGWCWRAVAERLRAAGHRVLTPTLPGLAERAASLSGEITLAGCAADVARLIEAQALRDIVLVGHSFGGAVVLGVTDQLSERIRRLILLDALVLESGESPFGIMEPEIVAARRRAASEAAGSARHRVRASRGSSRGRSRPPPPHAASDLNLRDCADPAPSPGKWPPLHLHPLHGPCLCLPRTLARACPAPAGLAMAGDRDRP